MANSRPEPLLSRKLNAAVQSLYEANKDYEDIAKEDNNKSAYYKKGEGKEVKEAKGAEEALAKIHKAASEIKAIFELDAKAEEEAKGDPKKQNFLLAKGQHGSLDNTPLHWLYNLASVMVNTIDGKEGSLKDVISYSVLTADGKSADGKKVFRAEDVSNKGKYCPPQPTNGLPTSDATKVVDFAKQEQEDGANAAVEEKKADSPLSTAAVGRFLKAALDVSLVESGEYSKDKPTAYNDAHEYDNKARSYYNKIMSEQRKAAFAKRVADGLQDIYSSLKPNAKEQDDAITGYEAAVGAIKADYTPPSAANAQGLLPGLKDRPAGYKGTQDQWIFHIQSRVNAVIEKWENEGKDWPDGAKGAAKADANIVLYQDDKQKIVLPYDRVTKDSVLYKAYKVDDFHKTWDLIEESLVKQGQDIAHITAADQKEYLSQIQRIQTKDSNSIIQSMQTLAMVTFSKDKKVEIKSYLDKHEVQAAIEARQRGMRDYYLHRFNLLSATKAELAHQAMWADMVLQTMLSSSSGPAVELTGPADLLQKYEMRSFELPKGKEEVKFDGKHKAEITWKKGGDNDSFHYQGRLDTPSNRGMIQLLTGLLKARNAICAEDSAKADSTSIRIYGGTDSESGKNARINGLIYLACAGGVKIEVDKYEGFREEDVVKASEFVQPAIALEMINQALQTTSTHWYTFVHGGRLLNVVNSSAYPVQWRMWEERMGRWTRETYRQIDAKRTSMLENKATGEEIVKEIRSFIENRNNGLGNKPETTNADAKTFSSHITPLYLVKHAVAQLEESFKPDTSETYRKNHLQTDLVNLLTILKALEGTAALSGERIRHERTSVYDSLDYSGFGTTYARDVIADLFNKIPSAAQEVVKAGLVKAKMITRDEAELTEDADEVLRNNHIIDPSTIANVTSALLTNQGGNAAVVSAGMKKTENSDDIKFYNSLIKSMRTSVIPRAAKDTKDTKNEVKRKVASHCPTPEVLENRARETIARNAGAGTFPGQIPELKPPK